MTLTAVGASFGEYTTAGGTSVGYRREKDTDSCGVLCKLLWVMTVKILTAVGASV